MPTLPLLATLCLIPKTRLLVYRVFCMPQIPFAFAFECDWPNDLCTTEVPFGCSSNMGNSPELAVHE